VSHALACLICVLPYLDAWMMSGRMYLANIERHGGTSTASITISQSSVHCCLLEREVSNSFRFRKLQGQITTSEIHLSSKGLCGESRVFHSFAFLSLSPTSLDPHCSNRLTMFYTSKISLQTSRFCSRPVLSNISRRFHVLQSEYIWAFLSWFLQDLEGEFTPPTPAEERSFLA
jgi:hypothetical protein